jgi:AcrR family transcriptional regulator
MKKATESETVNRKHEILEAALDCFLNYGYSKTSMNDVAQRANLSRPLLYLNFKNKVDLLQALYGYLMNNRCEQAQTIFNGSGTKKEKLTRAANILVLEPWQKISGHPKSLEFFESCSQHNQKNYALFEKKQLKVLEDFFDDKTEAEVFTFAANGAMEDLPSPSVLKKRLLVLIDKFT